MLGGPTGRDIVDVEESSVEPYREHPDETTVDRIVQTQRRQDLLERLSERGVLQFAGERPDDSRIGNQTESRVAYQAQQHVRNRNGIDDTQRQPGVAIRIQWRKLVVELRDGQRLQRLNGLSRWTPLRCSWRGLNRLEPFRL